MKKLLIASVLLIAGCASQIMEGFVGKDITEVMTSYGPPANRFELPDGRTAFQWQRNSAMMMPMTTTYTSYGSVGTAFTSGGSVISTQCFYTLYGQPNSQGSYTITGFAPPSLDCE